MYTDSAKFAIHDDYYYKARLHPGARFEVILNWVCGNMLRVSVGLFNVYECLLYVYGIFEIGKLYFLTPFQKGLFPYWIFQYSREEVFLYGMFRVS